MEVIRRAHRIALLTQTAEGVLRTKADRAAQEAADRRQCATDPIYWLRNYGLILNPKDPNPDTRKLPLILWPRQVELVRRALESKAKQETLLVNKAREIGVSWLMIHLVAHSWMFEQGFSAHLGSRKEELVDNRTIDSLFGKLRWVIEHQPTHLLSRDDYADTNSRLIHRRTGSEVTGESTNEGWGRSARKTVLFLDEFAHVEPALQARIWTGIETVAGCKWLVSTPNGKGNKFHALRETFKRDTPDKLIELDWRTDPRRTDEWFEERLLENGGDLTWDEREQEHACSFAGVKGERILKFDRERVEYTDPDLPAHCRERFLVAAAMDFGSGPSLTVLLAGIVDWGDPPGPPPNIWIDTERYWQRVPSRTIGTEGRAALGAYHGPVVVVGDPAGTAAEHDQQSWQSSLQAAGLPVRCLPAEYNTPYLIQKSLEEVQQGLERGWLRIHAERCPVTLEACESWEWDLPRGIPLTLVNKAEIKPKKDQWSHFGDALRYLVAAVLREMRPRVAQSKPEPETAGRARSSSIAGELRDILAEQGVGLGGGGWPMP